MVWQIEIERKALKSLKKIPEPYKSAITQAIDRLSEDPDQLRLVGSVARIKHRV